MSSEEQDKLKEKIMNIKVQVDAEQMQELMKENEALKQQLEDYEEKLRLIAEKEFERKVAQIQNFYGVTLSEEQLNRLKENPSSITILEHVLKENFQKQREIPSGITPLTREQGYITSQKEIPIEKREYPDYPSMIQDVRAENRQDILNKLFEKTINAIKKGEKTVIFEEPKESPSLSEQLDEKFFFEHIAPKLRRAGMSEDEILERFEARKKRKPKNDLRFKIEAVEK